MKRRVALAVLWSAVALGGSGVSSAAQNGIVTYTNRTSTRPQAERAETRDAVPPPNPSQTLALAALDRKIADLDAEESTAKHELASLSGKVNDAHQKAVQRGRSFYRMTRAGMLALGGGFDALVTHAMRVERQRRALISDLEEERNQRSRGAKLAMSLERVAKERVALSTERSAMDVARLAMQDESRRQEAFDRAFAAPSGADENGYVAIYGSANASPDPSGGGSAFSSAKGKLLFPVTGRTEVKQAHREGTDGPGLEVLSSAGTSVRAVFAGRVAFADRYGPYGKLVIVDHGEHYYSVSGNLASIDVKVGDEISSGERIGTVGDEGRGAMLYFEIRHGTQTVPPSPWLGL